MSLSKLSDTPVDLNFRNRPRSWTFSRGQPIPHAVADAQRVFTPPAPLSKPTELFSVQINNCSIPAYRFIRTTDSEQMLMFVDGSSLGNGLSNARAGYAVVFAPSNGFTPSLTVSNKMVIHRPATVPNYALFLLHLACACGLAKDSRRSLLRAIRITW